jgi:hypothetical protein
MASDSLAGAQLVGCLQQLADSSSAAAASSALDALLKVTKHKPLDPLM